MVNSLVKDLSEAEKYVNTINHKLSCKVATNASGTLNNDFEAGVKIDGKVLSAGDRILIKDQGDGSENGIYVVNTTGKPTRSTDMDSSETCRPNSFVFIEEGTTHADKMFQLTTDGDIIIDTTSLTFEEYGIPGVTSITPGDGITGTDTTGDITLSLDLKTNGGLTIETSKLAVDLSASSITGTLSISDGGTGATNASDARSNLGLSIGSDVQAYDSELSALASLTSAANKIPMFDGSGTATLIDFKDEDNMSSNSAKAVASQQSIKAYVDSVAQGLNLKGACRVATTTSGTLSTSFENGVTIDDIVLSTGDRILIKDQSNAIENGIYIVKASGAPDRSDDMAVGESAGGDFTFITEGTINGDYGFVCTSNGGSDIIGTDNLSFTQFSGAGQIIAGDGLEKSGNTLSIDVKANSGIVIDISSELSLDLSASSITGTLAISDGGTGATTASDARAALGLSIGSDVQAYDSGLTSIAGLTTAADKMIYTTGPDTYAVTSLTSFARTLLADTNASDARSTLGAGVGTVSSVSGSGGVNGLSLSGTVTSSGSLTLGGTLTINNDDWSGTDLSVANGGTGASSFTSNAVLTGNGTSAIQSESNLTFDGSNLNVSGSISVSGHIIPNASSTYDLGSSSYNFRDLYLSGSTINLGGTKISTNNSGDIELKDISDNPKKLMVDEIIIGTGTDRISLSKSNDKLKVGKRGTSGTGDIVPDTLDVSHGGTGHTTYNNGELLIGNGNATLSKATLTQGNNISITNGSGSITISGNYSVGDGGLTQNNFTDTLKSKLDAIADSANNYSLPISSSDTLGGIKVGNNLSIDVNGVLSSTDTNTTYSSGTGLTLNSNQFNIDSTVVTLTGLQILSNKTLTSPTLTTPILGTPQSGNLANCTFPTLNQDTSGSAGSVANALTAGTNISFSSGTTYDGSSPLVISVNDSFIKNSTDDTMIGTLTLSKISTTNTVLPALILQNSNLLSSGGIGLGVDMLFKIENSSGSIETTGGIRSTMIDPTNNTEDACLYFSTMSTGTYSTYLTLDGSTARINIGSTVNGIYLTKSTGSTINFGNNISLTHNSSGSTLDLTGASSGGFTCDGDITAFKSSDKRLKDNIIKIENPIEKIKKIGGYNFEWNKLGEEHTINKGNDVGVIAQEIEEILPEATTTRDNGYKAVQYEKIVPLLIECIKDQQNMIENLQGQIDEIKSNII